MEMGREGESGGEWGQVEGKVEGVQRPDGGGGGLLSLCLMCCLNLTIWQKSTPHVHPVP